MKVADTRLPGVRRIEPDVYPDARGYFLETFNRRRYEEALGRELDFVQDNLSRSSRGVLRGMHLQVTKPQAKLVRAVKGAVFDVVLDVNPGSDTFGQWFGETLSEENQLQLFIPAGYAHGFQVMSDEAVFEYKCIGYYEPGDESGVIWNDPRAAIRWPIPEPIVSAKDQLLPTLDTFRSST